MRSAGAHFNPTKAEHGTENPRGPHAGDLPNITVDATGQGHLEVTASRVTLERGPASLFGADGSALVVHAGPDDMRADPEAMAVFAPRAGSSFAPDRGDRAPTRG